ncbi:MAG: amidohydrolase [Bacillota bacterium]|jgi:predicted amidohydrolase YtcJ
MANTWNRNLDKCLVGGNILTQDPVLPRVSALGIKGSRIVMAGDDQQVLSAAGPETEVIDLGGQTVLPGIFDSHNHIVAAGVLLEGVMLFGVKDIAGMQAAVARRAEQLPKGSWIEGGGWIESQFAEYRLPTRWDLDQAAPDHPVILNRLFGSSVVNSLALQLAGIDGNTPDPERGQIDRDPRTGEPTGILRNGAQNLVRRVIPQAAVRNQVEQIEERIKRATAEYVKWGITSVIDPGVTPLSMRAYHNLRQRGELPLRVQMMPAWYGLYATQGKDISQLVDTLGFTTGFGDEWLNVGPLKMAIDGGLGSKTAMLHDPYIDGHVSRIPLRLDLEQLESYFRQAIEAGWSVGIHTCGDLAQDIACESFDRVLQALPLPGHRCNIIHGYLPTEKSLEIMARQQLAVSVQPGFTYVEGDIYFDQIEEQRLHRYKPLRTYLERGILVAANSDMTSAHYNPFFGMYAAVTRKTSQGRQLGTAELISREQMLPLFTKNGAWLARQEDRVGTLSPGKLADLIVLSDNILTVPDEKILQLSVRRTMIDGHWVWQDECSNG